MTGQELRVKLMEFGKSQKDIADSLGVTAQSLSSVLSAKDVRSGTIEKIAQVLNIPVSSLYGEKDSGAVASGNGSVAVAGNNNDVGNVTIGDASVLQERVKLLERLLEEKERTIQILMGK